MHFFSFLEGPKAALTASKDFLDGHYTSVPQHGIRAFGRAYSAWAYGQTVSTNEPYFRISAYSLISRQWFREHSYLHGGK